MLAIVAREPVVYVVVSIYDGLFKGGMLVIMYEVMAELAYPVGESLSLGFMLAVQYLIRFIMNMILCATVNPLLPIEVQRDLQDEKFYFYMILVGGLIILVCISFVLWLKSTFVMERYIVDAMFDADEEEGEEEDMQMKGFANDNGTILDESKDSASGHFGISSKK